MNHRTRCKQAISPQSGTRSCIAFKAEGEFNEKHNLFVTRSRQFQLSRAIQLALKCLVLASQFRHDSVDGAVFEIVFFSVAFEPRF